MLQKYELLLFIVHWFSFHKKSQIVLNWIWLYLKWSFYDSTKFEKYNNFYGSSHELHYHWSNCILPQKKIYELMKETYIYS